MARHKKEPTQEELQKKADDFDKQWNESMSHGSPKVVGDLPIDREQKRVWKR